MKKPSMFILAIIFAIAVLLSILYLFFIDRRTGEMWGVFVGCALILIGIALHISAGGKDD